MSTPQERVLIAGAGPTGMTAALELARLGIGVRLIEKTSKPAETSRAIGIHARTLELFEQRGLVAAMLAKGNPATATSVYGDGKRVLHLGFDHSSSKYAYILFLSQAETEAILRKALEEQGVVIEREVELIALGQSDHERAVTAILRHKDGSLESAIGDYMIDAEGAHSVARATLGLSFQGKTREENYALGDLYLDGDLPETDLHIFSSRFGFLGLFPMGHHRFRLIASNPISQPSPGTEPSLSELQQIYDQRSHIPVQFRDMSWSSWFRINSRMIEKLQVGRVFLGGDSAHIHSPAAAQGMNTGIQDMINLAWKLALVIKGDAQPKLLETYNEDRLPVIQNVLTKTEGLTSAIGSGNPVVRSVFNHLMPWIGGLDLLQENSAERMSQLALNYRESLLSVNDHRAGQLHAGDRVPDMEVRVLNQQSSATRLFQLLDPSCFTVFYSNLSEPGKTHEQITNAIQPWKDLMNGYHIGKPQADNGKHFETIFGTTSSILLVRPDGYVAFTGSEHSIPALAAYLGEWFPAQSNTKAKEQHA